MSINSDMWVYIIYLFLIRKQIWNKYYIKKNRKKEKNNFKELTNNYKSEDFLITLIFKYIYVEREI